ncbi:AdoMet-dependent rRNA methyltransferase spb1 [Ananas comosus]|uniref:Putative rRNA methyltransferase n=1 Tax=Ananas comosus TaxID=4615 RepID=A0A199UF23_ANACO|nr:AdoMet-dependent rRNA methyltransferase spb1 [Ananas comosus]
MGKAKGKQRKDKYYHLAREKGYRSRAAFKLLQLDASYRFLSTARSVLDLCAAPGGWLQVAVAHAPVGALVVGVDLCPIRPVRGALALAEDITTQRCRAEIQRVMNQRGCAAFDVVLHDGSPNVGGAWAQEATSQSALVVDAVRLATAFLVPKGTFVTKVFRSQDYSAIIYCLKQLFEKVDATKPVASRSTSAEIYVICQKYKAPAKIDPRLLDVKYLFQGAFERPKVVDVLHGSKQKRNREGYEDGNTTLWKVGLASDFVWSETPLEFLGSFNAISFEDPACLSIKNHELTTDEVKSLCEDLYVIDKNSFKHLLKWRLKLRKALSSAQKVTPKAADGDQEAKDNEDDQLLNEMEELTNVLDRKKKRAKKLLAKRRAKDKARKAFGQIDATEDSYFDRELFSLSSIKGKKELQAVESNELSEKEDADRNLGDSDSEEADAVADGDSPEEVDTDEEQQRYNDQLEDMLDEAYERYLNRKGGGTKQYKRAKRIDPNADEDLLEGGEEDDNLIEADHDADQDQEKELNPLMIPLDERSQPTKEQIMEQWYSQVVFAEAAEDGTLLKSDSEGEEREEKSLKLSKKAGNNVVVQQKESKPAKPARPQADDFEIVPQDPVAAETSDDSSSDESEEEEYDGYTKAEILAYAKKMLRKKQREQILDDAYNKYMFDDEGLPKWFAEEEKKHCQSIKPVTKEEVAAMRAQFREIDARPAKKVAEAKARKKRAAMKKLEKARQKADSIADQTDISERSKSKMIDQLYKKAMPKRPNKEYVVAKKGVSVKAGKGKVLVDRRMKKDARVRGMGKNGKGGGRKGKAAKGKGKGQKGKKGAYVAGRKAGKGNKRSKASMQD